MAVGYGPDGGGADTSRGKRFGQGEIAAERSAAGSAYSGIGRERVTFASELESPLPIGAQA
jgi:hypothetical protein